MALRKVMSVYMLSQYIVKTDIDNNAIAIYNSLIGDPVFASPDELEHILCGDVNTEIRQVLLKKGIYIDNENDDCLRLRRIIDYHRKRIGHVEFIMVMLTNNCNLACDYCIEREYIAKNHMSQNYLTEKTIDSFFEMISHGIFQLDSNVEFVLYGGEPLLNPKGIRYFLEKKRALSHAQCSLVTNATLLDKEMIEFLKEEKVKISISIDGPREITDEHRKFRNSSQSVFSKVKEAIECLKKSGVIWGISITLTNELIKNKNKFYIWLEETKPNTVAFNLLKLSFNYHEAQAAIEYYRTASVFLAEAHMKLISMGIAEIEITRKIKFFVEHQPVFADCAAASMNQITLNTNGDIFSCQCHMKDSNLFGNVFNPDTFKIPFECLQMFENLPVFKETCLQCHALPVCGGGCLIQGKMIFKNNQYLDKGYCDHAKNIMRWMLKRVYQSM